jgi:hypothetical protein
MQLNKALPATVLVLVWLLIWDNFLGAMVIGSAMAQIPGMTMEVSKLWESVGDLFVALVLVMMYDRVRGAFSAGLKGGLVYGFYAGLLTHFPTWLFMTVYAGWPYRPVWHLTLVLILVTMVSGALIGLVYEKMGGGQAAA